jgi:DNA-binding HxlR family transcriptional regulator
MKNISEKFIDTENCPVRQVLDRFADKWSMLVIILLGSEEKLRFNEIGQTIGNISQKMLTVTLRRLEADGLILRTQYPEIPPRVEYELTNLGRTLLPLIADLTAWAEKNIGTILENRTRISTRTAIA